MELHHYWSEMSGLRADKITEKLHLSPEQRERLLYAMGVDVRQKKLLPHGPVGIKKREIVMQAAIDYLASIGHQKTWEFCHQVFEEVDRISIGMIHRLVIPIPGAEGLVENLSSAGCRIAIATTDRSYRADLAMEALGFRKKIDLVIGADYVSEPKPNPEMIYYILDTLRVEKSQALMVGDAITDVEMGCRAGLIGTVGVLTGQTSREDLQQITPYIIGSVADMTVTPDSE
jgi:phosphoglycolate phosphatase